jgi:hypothetical protein
LSETVFWFILIAKAGNSLDRAVARIACCPPYELETKQDLLFRDAYSRSA